MIVKSDNNYNCNKLPSSKFSEFITMCKDTIENNNDKEFILRSGHLTKRKRSFFERKFNVYKNKPEISSHRRNTLIELKRSITNQLVDLYGLPKIKAKVVMGQMLIDRKINQRGLVRVSDVYYIYQHMDKYKHILDMIEKIQLLSSDLMWSEYVHKYHPDICTSVKNQLSNPGFWLSILPVISSLIDAIKAIEADKLHVRCQESLYNSSSNNILKATILTTLNTYFEDKRNRKIVSAVGKPLLLSVALLTGGGIAMATENALAKGITVTEPFIIQKILPRLIQSSTNKALEESVNYITQKVQYLVNESRCIPKELRQSTELFHDSILHDGIFMKGKPLRKILEAVGITDPYENTLADYKSCKAFLEYLDRSVNDLSCCIDSEEIMDIRSSFYKDISINQQEWSSKIYSSMKV